MSSHHHTDDIQHLYEGDQSKLYSGVLAHHEGDINSSASKTQVKRILMITLYLSIITIVEVGLGLISHSSGIPMTFYNFVFLILTLLKAFMIVRVFMHLGDEKKNFITTVLLPLSFFVWFIIAFLADGAFWLHMNSHVRAGMPAQTTEATK